ncbi:MAG: hypothetical protein QNK03_04730, partial [Myxococcota bacterium]|nr:hypothetical protein [Myxococcota bacterium]
AEIDAGRQLFDLEGQVASFQGSDQAQVVAEYLDVSGAVLDAFASDARSPGPGWVRVFERRVAPVGTRAVRVRLLATREAGADNDGYFDALSLRARVDRDADRLPDAEEPRVGTDPDDPDSDGDGLLDGEDPAPLVATRLLGPARYLSSADSPFLSPVGGGFRLGDADFFLEDFEGSAELPGVTIGGSRQAPGGITDSVDGDDGRIDGSGTGGVSRFSGSGTAGITIDFDAGLLGTLPTHVGAVWTDGVGVPSAEFFDAAGVSLGTLEAPDAADASFAGTTGEDRFFGAIHAAGISRMVVRSGAGGGIEIDHVQLGLRGFPTVRFAQQLIGIPTGATGTLRLRLGRPHSSDLVVGLSSLDPGVAASELAEVLVPAGETEVALRAQGVADGTTTIVAESAFGAASASVSVSVPDPALEQSAFARVVGTAYLPLPSAAPVILSPGATATVAVPVLAEPAAAPTDVVVSRGDPAVAGVAPGVVIPSGGTTAVVTITATPAGGSTRFELAAGSDRVALPVRAEAVDPATLAVVAARPVGIALRPLPSAGALVLPIGGTRTVSIPLLAEPADQRVTATASSSDASVARVLGDVEVQVDEITAPVTIEAGGAAGEALIELRVGRDGRSLRVVVGELAPEDAPPVLSPVVGITVRPLPSAGFVVLPESGTQRVRVPVVSTTDLERRTVTVTNSNPAAVQVVGDVAVEPGDTTAFVDLVAGAQPGRAELELRVGDEGVRLRVEVGLVDPERVPPVLSPTMGITVRPLPSAGFVVLPEGGTQTVRVPVVSTTDVERRTVTVTNSNPAAVQVVGAVVVEPRDVTAAVELQAGPDPGAARIELRVGDEGVTLRIEVGLVDPGRVPAVLSPPVGGIVRPLPSAGFAVLPEGGAQTIRLPVVSTSEDAPRTVSVANSNPAVVQVVGGVQIEAREVTAAVPLQAGAVSGVALLTLRVGDEGVVLRVRVGAIPADEVPPVVAPAVGGVVRPGGDLGTLYLDVGVARSVRLRLGAFPALADLPVTATSRDPLVATVAPAAQTLRTGELELEFDVAATAAADAETFVDITVAGQRHTLRVVVGLPAAGDAPTTLAPPVGVEVQEP